MYVQNVGRQRNIVDGRHRVAPSILLSFCYLPRTVHHKIGDLSSSFNNIIIIATTRYRSFGG